MQNDQVAADNAGEVRLRIRGVSVDYGALRAVDAVDLDVGGEGRAVVALLGPSGCGKSTLLRALAGIEPLAGGAVEFDAADLARIPAHRRGFGLVFQDGQLFPHRSVAGNIAYGLRGPYGRPIGSRAERAERIDELLALVGMDGYGARRVGELSGGQAQRVALARALAPRPRMLLLDEPLSSLDRELRDRLVVDIARILRTTGTPALLVTHDHGEAAALAERIAVMRDGRITQEAAPRELWRYPRDVETARFLGYPVVLDAEVEDGVAHGRLGPVPVTHPDGPVRLGLRAESILAAPVGAADDDETTGVRATVETVTVLPSRTLVTVTLPWSSSAEPSVVKSSRADSSPFGGGPITATLGSGTAVPGDVVDVRLAAGMIAVITGDSVREVAAGAIVRDGKVLLAQRSRPPEMAGLWELPGGKVEPGESGAEGLRRELDEELGVTVRVVRRLPGEVSLGGTMVLRAYAAELETGEPEAREHTALRWVTADELDDAELVENDRTWLQALRKLLTQH